VRARILDRPTLRKVNPLELYHNNSTLDHCR
jgi:hypothetical protein